jgi:hypothetical protein
MNFPQNKIFYFLEYWPIPFGVLQTCCKIQKCKKTIFFLFKKSMRKHVFKTSNIFCIKSNVQKMLGYWPYATHKNIFYIFLSKKAQASQLIAIKNNKPCAYILKVCEKTEQSRKKKEERMDLRT